MRVKMILTLTVLLVILASSSLAAQDASTQTTYNFVYAYQAQRREIGIGMVDPTLNPVSANVVTMSVEELWTLAGGAKSVGNEWIALAFRAGPGYVMRLVNLSTTEIRDVAVDFLFTPPQGTIMGPQQEFVWSPDGRYLAFNIFEPGDEPISDTLVYSVADHQIVRLTNDDAWQSHLAWSPDSRQLAIATVTCAEECSASIDLFDPVIHSRTASLSVTPGAIGANLIGGSGLCHLDWSPNGRYISFMAICDSSAYATYKEMYLLEVVSGTLTQITDFTFQQERIPPNYVVSADYEPTWVNNEPLLISAIHGLGENIRSETLEYNVATGTLNKVSDQYVTEWAVNPVSQALAFQSIGTDPDTYYDQRQSQPVEVAPIEAVSEATAATDVLPASVTAPAGCDLTWSPDGAVLAYSVLNGEICGSDPQSFGFINGARGAVTQYVPTFEGVEPFNLMTVGWVAK